ncbi:DNA-binding winged helix-turn-helix (wHTH) protein [Serratia fonticola]|jgi:DNA-binding winged helix-turn-helix (wHTH) protein|uniref:DNA-binding winged helix-turn-helix (WHTH) protein n=1 Tax=Serratia fonticola TaxID=47917 RepID=A0A542D9B6_SERFO|nr:winged helix-turn-helix domain-containing protein [Serratia fonticola]TQI78364.1 DNA-binding winged helix-turn-helix (wHTH) protein [Serratia fonticola]TQI99614.1 DNA-binding winged helix-turn-helix (wHTH) protein [Serratia fonticola]TVZ69137.1 DNA-binding winged helix-turn-helix (wHTH) protein [Serratia fonticola]
MQFLINNSVTFSSIDGSLFNNENKDNIVILPLMASRVFTFLLTNAGKVVPRDEIFNYAWENRNLVASNNSLTQYISTIRRTLLEVNCNEEIIETIPKKGFYISEKIVTEIQCNEDYIISQNNPIKKSMLFPLLAMIAMMITLIFYQLYSYHERVLSRELLYLGKIDSCRVYILEKTADSNKERILNSIRRIIETPQYNIGCIDKLSYIYKSDEFFLFDGKGRAFISRCNIPEEIRPTISECKGIYIHAR